MPVGYASRKFYLFTYALNWFSFFVISFLIIFFFSSEGCFFFLKNLLVAYCPVNINSLTLKLTVLLFWLTFNLDVSFCCIGSLCFIRNPDYVVVSASICLSINSDRHAAFYCLSEMVFLVISERFRWRIFLIWTLLLLPVSFANGFRLELMFLSLIEILG